MSFAPPSSGFSGVNGFVDFKNDISEGSYDHASSHQDYENHHAFYTFEDYKWIGNKVPRPIDGTQAPGVVYVSGSQPVLSASFYTRCPSTRLSVTPRWEFEVAGVNYVMNFQTQILNPVAFVGAPFEAMVFYDWSQADISFPAGFTLAFESADIMFEVQEVVPSNQVSEFNETFVGGPDVYVLADEPNLGGQCADGDELIARYSSIRNGCFHGNGTNYRLEFSSTVLNGYFLSLNSKRGKSGIALEYWDRTTSNYCTTMAEMFDSGDGRCGLFSCYLLEMIACQGYDVSGLEVGVFPKDNSPSLPSDRGTIDTKVQNTFGLGARFLHLLNPRPVSFVVVQDPGWDMNKAYKLSGFATYMENKNIELSRGVNVGIVPAQNNTSPRHIFSDHVLQYHLIGGSYGLLLDPSYGVSTIAGTRNDAIQDLENTSISVVRAVVGQVELTQFGFRTTYDVIVPIDFNNTSIEELYHYGL